MIFSVYLQYFIYMIGSILSVALVQVLTFHRMEVISIRAEHSLGRIVIDGGLFLLSFIAYNLLWFVSFYCWRVGRAILFKQEWSLESSHVDLG